MNLMSAQDFSSESEYRACIQDSFKKIEKVFEDVDPDVAECDQQFGVLTIRLADQSRCILSAQPSVRQLWLALAAKGVAHHFNYDFAQKRWMDDKGKGLELLSCLSAFLNEETGLNLKLI
ncbi:MAG: iron donor protein CyaY [Methylotenera sp.]|nr:iron donor protein CyaY [Oligoflexia bacterium]